MEVCVSEPGELPIKDKSSEQISSWMWQQTSVVTNERPGLTLTVVQSRIIE